jgi:hypothetical protein
MERLRGGSSSVRIVPVSGEVVSFVTKEIQVCRESPAYIAEGIAG